MGEANLYKYKVLFKYKNQTRDSVKVTTGLRTIELVQQPDSAGKSFYFKVNGIPVFARGANYIPPDNFLPRVSDEKYRQIIEDAKKANMNILRVWGGGTYEKDIFYRLCDKNGIMVWQDFMFACNMSPGDSAFLENVKTEAEENVKRLRNHPSIALWCGNNEVDEAWHNWGWQKQYHYSKEDSAKLWNAYLDIFENILPKTVNQYAPNTFYWPSSPSIGWGHREAFTQGDAHYWEVWWGRKPFSYYEKKIGRFMSEYGFQGMPDMKNINEFTLPEDQKMGSKVLDVHQKHPFGWEAIRQYMERDFPVPDNLEEYDYVSQLLQAEGIGMAIEAHRRAKPYCMGTLYWQLNDCWPVVSWSSFDYYGRWKALHYTVKKDYAPFLISFDNNPDSLRIWIVNDKQSGIKATLQWTIMDFSGNKLASGNQKQFTEPNSSKVSYSINKSLFASFDSTSTVLNAVLIADDSTLLAENNYYFAKPKNLQLEKPEITIHLNKQKNGYLIRLKSVKLARGIQLSTNVDGFFEDNYFDILPGETKTLFFTTDHIFNKEDLKIRSLYNITTLQ
jgi:beta-mannosidase